MAQNKGTTNPGYKNRNSQVVREKTSWAGTDHNQMICILRCEKCGFSYGANTSDVFQRKCPNCGPAGEPCSNPECPAKPDKGNCERCRAA